MIIIGDTVYYTNPWDKKTDACIVLNVYRNDVGDMVAEVKGGTTHVVTRLKNLKQRNDEFIKVMGERGNNK